MPDSTGAFAPVQDSIRSFSSIVANRLGSAEKAMIMWHLAIGCDWKWKSISLAEWGKLIPWKCEATIRRYLHELESDGWLWRMNPPGESPKFCAGGAYL